MTQEFYDQLSPFYHLVYPDWERSVARQASKLDGIIKENWGEGARSILDVACGIGTQAIGLAGLGYDVAGSDLSPKAIERAREQAKRRDLSIPLQVADIRGLSEAHQRTFGVVLACDNAIPHLLTDDDLRTGFDQMHRCLRPGGGCLISVRDYAAMELGGTRVVPYGVRHEGDDKFLVFQLWEFDGDYYDVTMYFVRDAGELTCETTAMRTRYYTVSIARLCELMEEVGFRDVRRIDGRYFQPVIIGTKG